MKQRADAQSRVNSWAQWSQRLILPAFISHILTTNSVQPHVFQTSRHGMHFICSNSCSQAEPFPVLGGIPSTDTWTLCDLNHKELETQDILIYAHIWEMKTQSSVWSSLSRIILATRLCVCMRIHFVCEFQCLLVCFTCVRVHLWKKPEWQSVAFQATSLRCWADALRMQLLRWQQQHTVTFSDRWSVPVLGFSSVTLAVSSLSLLVEENMSAYIPSKFCF